MLQVQSPFQQFFDSSGKPLDNGYIYIGAAGQNPETNPIAIYWDDQLTIPAAQPIRTLNGYVVRSGTPARLFVATEDFSITVKTKKREVVFSALDATSLSNLQAQLASSSGSSMVGFIQVGTGAVTRTAQDKMREVYSVKDFGAVGNGVADDTQAFIDAIGAYADARAIYVPPGTYLVKNTIFLGINKKLFGQSSVSTLIKFDSPDQNCIQGDAFTHVEGLTIQKIVLASRTGLASHTPTTANGWRNGVVRDVVIIDFDIGVGSTQGLVQGLMFQNVYERVRIYNATTGVEMGSGSNANTWLNCEFWNCGLPINLNNVTTQDFVCCGFEGTTGSYDFVVAACNNITFDTCYFEPAKGGVFDDSTGSFIGCHATKFDTASTIFLQALNNSSVYMHDFTDYNFGGGSVAFQKYYVAFTGSVVYGLNCTTRGGGQKVTNYSIDGVILDVITDGPNRIVKYGNGWQTIDVNFEQLAAPIMTGATTSYSATLSLAAYPFIDNRFSAVANIYANAAASFLLIDNPLIAVRPVSGSSLDIAAKRSTTLTVDGFFYSIHMAGRWK